VIGAGGDRGEVNRGKTNPGDRGEADGDGINRGEADSGGSCSMAPMPVPILSGRFPAVNLAVFLRKMDSFCEDITARE
jgi:hypothetical protein